MYGPCISDQVYSAEFKLAIAKSHGNVHVLDAASATRSAKGLGAGTAITARNFLALSNSVTINFSAQIRKRPQSSCSGYAMA
jgi:hypothetical protein